MQRGELPESEKKEFLATYFTGLFRAMRFGIDEAHGGGAAFQYSFFKEVGAITWDDEQKRFFINFDKMEQAISDLTARVVILQGNGVYADAKTFLEDYASLDDHAHSVLANTSQIPTDIAPRYPSKI